MSRSTVAKSRAEKGGKSTNAPTPAVTHEIIPGKFNDQDWNLMVDHDDGDDFVLDLVEELCGSALDVIYQNYLQRQLVPFTVMQAKDALLQIIEWQFLSRDEGEVDVDGDPGWAQEEEPEPAVTDCWAQGSVPRKATNTPRPVTEDAGQENQLPEVAEEDEEPAPQEDVAQGESEGAAACAEAEPEAVEPKPITPPPPATPQREDTQVTQESAKPSPTPEQQGKTKRRSKFKPYAGKLKSAGVKRMTESLDQYEMNLMMEEMSQHMMDYTPDPDSFNMPSSCHSIVKLQSGRPPGNREIMYDDTGNIVKMNKINPARLPSHRVRTGFHVVDPQVEAAQARLEAMRTGRHIKGARAKDTSKGSATKYFAAPSIRKTPSHASHSRGHDKMDSMPQPLLECMDISAGVIVREGERVKRGPKLQLHRSELVAGTVQKGLRPVTFKAAVPILTVQELLERDSPIIRPLQATPPIPPIQPKAMEMA